MPAVAVTKSNTKIKKYTLCKDTNFLTDTRNMQEACGKQFYSNSKQDVITDPFFILTLVAGAIGSYGIFRLFN